MEIGTYIFIGRGENLYQVIGQTEKAYKLTYFGSKEIVKWVPKTGLSLQKKDTRLFAGSPNRYLLKDWVKNF